MATAEIFDRELRRLRRDRAARAGTGDFVRAHIAGELMARLDLVTRRFTDALDVGASDNVIAAGLRERGAKVTTCDAGALFAARAGGVQADEDRLPFAPGSFDLILAAGGLDQVNDLPGALIQLRRALRADGLLLAAFVGAGSLPMLRAALHAADMAGPDAAAAPRIHPQIDVRSAGDLLQRAGFALPVVDGERLTVRYASLGALVRDVRAAGAANLLHARARAPFSRWQAAAAEAAFASQAGADGKVGETLELVYLSGWAPAESQPKPARRGSATASLADALKPPKP